MAYDDENRKQLLIWGLLKLLLLTLLNCVKKSKLVET